MIIKAIPTRRDTRRRRFLSINRFSFPYCCDISSAVTKRIIAVIASQSVMSNKERGNCIQSVLVLFISLFQENKYIWNKKC